MGTHGKGIQTSNTKNVEFHRVIPISFEYLECGNQRLLKLSYVLCPQDLVVISFFSNWPELNTFISSLYSIEWIVTLILERVYLSSETRTFKSTLGSLSKLELHWKHCVLLWDFAIIMNVFACLPCVLEFLPSEIASLIIAII